MLWTIILFLVLLSVLVLVHELGHFIVAKKSGVAVEEFGLGFPPRLLKKHFRGTDYTLNLLPLGGFVRIKGVADDEKDLSRMEDADSFSKKPFLKRFLILFAGIFMNAVLTWALLSVGFMAGIPALVDDTLDASAKISDEKIQIISLEENSSAQKSGLEIGDTIVKIDGQKFASIDDIQNYHASKTGGTVSVTIDHRGERQTKDIPLMILENGKAGLGVGLVETARVSYPFLTSIGRGLTTTLSLTGQIFAAIGSMISQLIQGRGVPQDVTGPVGIAVLTGQVVDLGWIYVLQFAALLSLNLAIFNLLPIPALDGGRLAILIVERIRGKKLAHVVESRLHQLGFVGLLLLIFLVTVRDLRFYADNIGAFFSRWF